MSNASASNRRFHGLNSLAIILAVFGWALLVVFSNSRPLGWVYAALLPLGLVTIVCSFCSKCPCRADSCGHWLPGKLTNILPKRREGPYTKSDIVGVAIPFLIIVGFPQYWLVRSHWLLLIFWLPLIYALVEIRLFVCRGCENRHCPAASRVDKRQGGG